MPYSSAHPFATQILHRLTRCPLYVGPGDNLRSKVSPSDLSAQPHCNPEDCKEYLERLRIADGVDPTAEPISPYESASRDGSEDDSADCFAESEDVISEDTKGSSTVTVLNVDNPGGRKLTNHIEPDFDLLWNESGVPFYGCPRSAVTCEAKRWYSVRTKGGSSNVSF